MSSVPPRSLTQVELDSQPYPFIANGQRCDSVNVLLSIIHRLAIAEDLRLEMLDHVFHHFPVGDRSGLWKLRHYHFKLLEVI